MLRPSARRVHPLSNPVYHMLKDWWTLLLHETWSDMPGCSFRWALTTTFYLTDQLQLLACFCRLCLLSPYASNHVCCCCCCFLLLGAVNTELFRKLPIWLKPFFLLITKLFFRDSSYGAQTSIYCATQEGIEMFSGRYFVDCRVKDPKPHACDDPVAKKLWEFSERLVGLAD